MPFALRTPIVSGSKGLASGAPARLLPLSPLLLSVAGAALTAGFFPGAVGQKGELHMTEEIINKAFDEVFETVCALQRMGINQSAEVVRWLDDLSIALLNTFYDKTP